jgi:membrane associated rhomboid family serine protease
MSPAALDPRGGHGGFDAGFSTSTVTRKLLWANGIAFVVTLVLWRYTQFGERIYDWLHLDPKAWYGGLPAVWQLWSYGFLHDLSSPFHLLFNLLALYFFGTMLEAMVGSRPFAWQYFTALAFGALVHLALAPAMGYPSVVGASGAVLYTVIACATLRPNAQVLFFFVPMPMKVMALILVGLDVFTVISGGSRTAADIHLAGAALGFASAKLGWVHFDPQAWWAARRVANAARSEASDKQRLDQLLERIHREGIHSLSQRDKDFLSRMSKRD